MYLRCYITYTVLVCRKPTKRKQTFSLKNMFYTIIFMNMLHYTSLRMYATTPNPEVKLLRKDM